MTFHVFRCLYCGRWGVKEIRTSIRTATYRCPYCNKTKKIYDSKNFGLNLMHKGSFGTGQRAGEVARRLNAR